MGRLKSTKRRNCKLIIDVGNRSEEDMVATDSTGQLTDNAIKVLEKRYLIRGKNNKPKEAPIELFQRVAKSLASTETNPTQWSTKFFNLMWDLDFMPNSPTLMNAGTGAGTLSACYVLDIDDSMSSIMMTAHDQAMIEKFGGGIGFSLSALRPRNTPIATTQGRACGPVAVLQTLSQVGTMITQGGKRDGAHMAIMSVYHPDIEEFISCKTVEGEIHNFNISVGADAGFMQAVKEDKYLHLTWPLDQHSYTKAEVDDSKSTGRFVKASDLFSTMIDGAWRNGEPGMVWLDRINQDNTTPALGAINATNPCGEQPLLSGESCNLGSINLGNYVKPSNGSSVGFDMDRFVDTVKTCVRMLDNVIEANTHPTEKTQNMNDQTRKIGLGVMGWADCLIRMGIPYDSSEALELAELIGSQLQETADEYSSYLGKTKGDFPAFAESTLNKKNGGKWDHMRNAWRLSIAPTGSISMIADCSSGIEPLFALSYKKHNLSSQLEDVALFYVNEDFQQHIPGINVNDFLEEGGDLYSLVKDDIQDLFTTTGRISPESHVEMQAVWQQFVDSGISKTINLSNTASIEDVRTAYMLAWERDCKGITVYRAGSRQKEVLVSTTDVLKNDEELTSRTKLARPKTLAGTTTKINTGLGTLYVTVNRDDSGNMYEVFATIGKAGGTEVANTEAICRLASLAMQYGIPTEEISNQLVGIQSEPAWDQGVLMKSMPDAIGKTLAQMNDVDSFVLTPTQSAQENYGIEARRRVEMGTSVATCPICKSDGLAMEEGCLKCHACGYSKCG